MTFPLCVCVLGFVGESRQEGGRVWAAWLCHLPPWTSFRSEFRIHPSRFCMIDVDEELMPLLRGVSASPRGEHKRLGGPHRAPCSPAAPCSTVAGGGRWTCLRSSASRSRVMTHLRRSGRPELRLSRWWVSQPVTCRTVGAVDLFRRRELRRAKRLEPAPDTAAAPVVAAIVVLTEQEAVVGASSLVTHAMGAWPGGQARSSSASTTASLISGRLVAVRSVTVRSLARSRRWASPSACSGSSSSAR